MTSRAHGSKPATCHRHTEGRHQCLFSGQALPAAADPLHCANRSHLVVTRRQLGAQSTSMMMSRTSMTRDPPAARGAQAKRAMRGIAFSCHGALSSLPPAQKRPALKRFKDVLKGTGLETAEALRPVQPRTQALERCSALCSATWHDEGTGCPAQNLWRAMVLPWKHSGRDSFPGWLPEEVLATAQTMHPVLSMSPRAQRGPLEGSRLPA